jgi:hypothetical protein
MPACRLTNGASRQARVERPMILVPTTKTTAGLSAESTSRVASSFTELTRTAGSTGESLRWEADRISAIRDRARRSSTGIAPRRKSTCPRATRTPTRRARRTAKCQPGMGRSTTSVVSMPADRRALMTTLVAAHGEASTTTDLSGCSGEVAGIAYHGQRAKSAIGTWVSGHTTWTAPDQIRRRF